MFDNNFADLILDLRGKKHKCIAFKYRVPKYISAYVLATAPRTTFQHFLSSCLGHFLKLFPIEHYADVKTVDDSCLKSNYTILPEKKTKKQPLSL